jgi:hypothetical protein
MLCSVYFSLYRVSNLLTPFSPPEVAITPTTLLIHNKNSLVDIYETMFIDDTCMDKTLMCMEETLMCMDDTYV